MNNQNKENIKKLTQNKYDKIGEKSTIPKSKQYHNRSSTKKQHKEKQVELKQQPLKLKIQEISQIEERLKNEAPERGTNPIANDLDIAKDTTKKTQTEFKVSLPSSTMFNELPISNITIKALTESKFTVMTDIQRASIPHSLVNRDILGAARTGSGKTLAYIIPILELLWRNRWSRNDGIGAIILSPTRELAIQIFEVLRMAGRFHNFSAGLIIGGKNVEEEKKRINSMNILIATPGRLLQHMDETSGFDCSNLRILVLDEADRILDLGFSKALNSIVENLPVERQTLLFSATQTKSIRDLARLSLKEPEYVSVYEKDLMSTPVNLTQTVCVVSIENKLNVLYSFIQTHLTSKIIVFLASCKQVRYVYETFKLLNPGTTLYPLHGRMKAHTRLDVFKQFTRSKAGALFATDIAARGLDFPAVNWVIQADCPDDIATYIHRVGRTARYQENGQSMIILLPSEKDGMIKQMEKHNIQFNLMEPNPSKITTVQPQLTGFVSSNPELKYLAQKSLVTYLRSIYKQENKEIFKISEINFTKYSESLGLVGSPQIEFGKKSSNAKKNTSFLVSSIQKKIKEKKEKGKVDDSDDSDDEKEKKRIVNSDDDSDNEVTNIQRPLSKIDKLLKRKNQGVLSNNFDKLRSKDDKVEDDDMFVLKRENHEIENEIDLSNVTKKEARKINKFLNNPEAFTLKESKVTPKDAKLTGEYLENIKKSLKDVDDVDKQVQKERLKKKRQLAKKSLKPKDEDEPVAYLRTPNDNDNSDNESNEEDEEDEEEGSYSDEEMSDVDDNNEDEDEDDSDFKPKNSDSKKRVLINQQEDLALQILAKKNKLK